LLICFANADLDLSGTVCTIGVEPGTMDSSPICAVEPSRRWTTRGEATQASASALTDIGQNALMFAVLTVDAMVRSSLPRGGLFPYAFDSFLLSTQNL
jgi:hypothetical protein